jgi:hypothetical protein
VQAADGKPAINARDASAWVNSAGQIAAVSVHTRAQQDQHRERPGGRLDDPSRHSS